MPNPGHRWPWPQYRKAVLIRDRFTCQIRGPGCTVTATNVDYIVSWRDGGPMTMPNLRAACEHCNKSRGAIDGRYARALGPSRRW
jgi:5-methylcytosine-specific restriction enzyme A